MIPTQSTILRSKMAHPARAIRKFLALDIETAKVLPDGADLRSQRPLGICCAAVLAGGDDQPKLWYSVNPDGTPCGRSAPEILLSCWILWAAESQPVLPS